VPEASFHDQLLVRFQAVRKQTPDTARLALLHIGAQQTGIVVCCDPGPPAVLTLALGSQKTAHAHFRHRPPSPLELENAISVVEDEVTRARPLMTPGTPLYTTDASLRDIAVRAGVLESPRLYLPLETMERLFDRLTQVSLGRPASFEGLPDTGDFAATLLILREFLHHLRFAGIWVVALK